MIQNKMCEYPKCKAEAVFKLGLADLDSEGSYYCSGHTDIRKHELDIKLSGWRTKRCVVVTRGGVQCCNSKRFGNFCGIHIKVRP